MSRFIQSIALPNTDVVASADITPFDLPVNPLSMLILRFQITNTQPAAIGTYSAIDDVITQITNLRVTHKGEDILNGSLRDLMVSMALWGGVFPGWGFMDNTNGGVRSIAFPLLLGRRPWDPMSCFPATTRGNLRMFMTAGADGAGYSDINMSVEAVELIDAQPQEYVKRVTSAMTSVAGQFDAPLPIGNDLYGVLLFDTGLGGSSDEVLSWGTIKLLKDSVEQYYPLSDYETLAAMTHAHLRQMLAWPGHEHLTDGATAALNRSDDAEVKASLGMRGYAALNFDPTHDGMYVMETAGSADLKIRAQGDEATAVRWIPIERVKITR